MGLPEPSAGPPRPLGSLGAAEVAAMTGRARPRRAPRRKRTLSPATESVAGSSEQVRYLPTVETKAKELVARLRDRSKLYPEGIADAFDAAEATAAADTIQALLDKLNDDESELEERPVPDVRQPL